MKKSLCLILLLCAVCLPLCASCSSHKELDLALEEMCRTEAMLPAGQKYLLSEPLKKGWKKLSQEHLATLFRSTTFPPALENVTQGALYLSFSHPFEIAVFACASRADCDAVAQLCLGRLEAVRSYWRESEYAEVCNSGSVTVCGNYVLMVISSSPEDAVKAFRRG